MCVWCESIVHCPVHAWNSIFRLTPSVSTLKQRTRTRQHEIQKYRKIISTQSHWLHALSFCGCDLREKDEIKMSIYSLLWNVNRFLFIFFSGAGSISGFIFATHLYRAIKLQTLIYLLGSRPMHAPRQTLEWCEWTEKYQRTVRVYTLSVTRNHDDANECGIYYDEIIFYFYIWRCSPRIRSIHSILSIRVTCGTMEFWYGWNIGQKESEIALTKCVCLFGHFIITFAVRACVLDWGDMIAFLWLVWLSIYLSRRCIICHLVWVFYLTKKP